MYTVHDFECPERFGTWNYNYTLMYSIDSSRNTYTWQLNRDVAGF